MISKFIIIFFFGAHTLQAEANCMTALEEESNFNYSSVRWDEKFSADARGNFTKDTRNNLLNDPSYLSNLVAQRHTELGVTPDIEQGALLRQKVAQSIRKKLDLAEPFNRYHVDELIFQEARSIAIKSGSTTGNPLLPRYYRAVAFAGINAKYSIPDTFNVPEGHRHYRELQEIHKKLTSARDILYVGDKSLSPNTEPYIINDLAAQFNRLLE